MVRTFSFISIAAALVAASSFAQGPEMRRGGGPGDFALLHAEFGISNKVVQGAPYSATAVTQFTQTLSTGDHIQRTTSASVARDSLGRTRMDRSLATVGALSATGGGHDRAIIIHDPVAGMSYALDPASHTARSTPIPAARAGSAEGRVYAGPARELAAAKTEDLGTQMIQGLSVQGKRVTRAIPAGKEGNEKEIDIVTETWYSADLHVVVMSKTSDPRYGESVYQLNAVARTEPDPTLFVVPADYAVKEGRALPGGRMRRGPAAPAQ
jgi:hypothetical protein